MCDPLRAAADSYSCSELEEAVRGMKGDEQRERVKHPALLTTSSTLNTTATARLQVRRMILNDSFGSLRLPSSRRL